MLADAGVELGINGNYPMPVISIEESEQALAQAMATIQQSLVEETDEVSLLQLWYGLSDYHLSGVNCSRLIVASFPGSLPSLFDAITQQIVELSSPCGHRVSASLPPCDTCAWPSAVCEALSERALPALQHPFRPASDPSVLRTSRATPALTNPSSVHMPPRRAPGEAEAARETAGEFTAAAERARVPDHRSYALAEHEAGLAGQGAKVVSCLLRAILRVPVKANRSKQAAH